MTRLGTIIELTLREALRRRILWIALALGVVFVGLYGLGIRAIVRDMSGDGNWHPAYDAGFSMVVVAGLYVVSFLGVMLAVLMGVGSVSTEVHSDVIQSLATKPLPRRSIILGKWIGMVAMLSGYIGLLCLGIIGITWLFSRYVPPSYGLGIVMIVFQAVIMLTISFAAGVWLPPIATGVAGFMLYGLAFIGGWVEQIGAVINNQSAVEIGIVASLIVPSEAMWKAASYRLQHPLMGMLGDHPFAPVSRPSGAMIVYALLYTAAALYASVRAFERRDL